MPPATHPHAAAGPRPPRPDLTRASIAALLCLAGLAATWLIAALVPVAHVHDASTLYDFTQLSRPRVDRLANGVLGVLEPLPFTLWGGLLVLVALLRGRLRVAVAVAAVLALAPFSAETLKPLLAHPHAYVGLQDVKAASWPSGHATAAAILALCAVLVAPRRLRPAVAMAGGAFVLATGVSLLILAWHMPSDVIGGYLLAGLWISLAILFLRVTERRRPGRRAARALPRARAVRTVRTGLPQ